LLFFLSELQY